MALEALAWLVGQPAAISRFLTMSGLEAGDLRRSVGDPGLQASVLDYVLANEALLLEFCQSASLKPHLVHAARDQLER